MPVRQARKGTLQVFRRGHLVFLPPHNGRPDNAKSLPEVGAGEIQSFSEMGDLIWHGRKSARRTLQVKCHGHSPFWKCGAMSTLSERLKLAREKAGFTTVTQAAEAMGISRFTYTQHENGTRAFGKDRAIQYAKKFKVSLEWLLTGRGDAGRRAAEALLVGKVGAGAEIVRFEHPDVLAGIPLPFGVDAPNVAEIEGDSQYPLQPGWLIFYGPENQGVPDSCIGNLCVVQLKDGRTLLKTLRRGGKRGLFRLESWNAPPMEDQRVEWAALVEDIRPRAGRSK